jgi:hypothetical protein
MGLARRLTDPSCWSPSLTHPIPPRLVDEGNHEPLGALQGHRTHELPTPVRAFADGRGRAGRSALPGMQKRVTLHRPPLVHSLKRLYCYKENVGVPMALGDGGG